MRSAALALAVAIALSPAAASAQSPALMKQLTEASAPRLTERYGAAALQYGELRLPPGKGPFPVAVMIHGGCWTKGFSTVREFAALSDAVTAAGFATWNLEYRQVGDPGAGWPGTFQDWAAGADHLRTLARTQPLDLKRVIAVGHSAGALGAFWLAARPKLPANSPVRGARPLALKAVVAIDGPTDLARFVGRDAQVCGSPVIAGLMGGAPGAVRDDRYHQASPYEQLPLRVRQLIVNSQVSRPTDGEFHRETATKAGDDVRVLSIKNGDHFDVISPWTEHGREVVAFIRAQALPEKR